MREPYMSNNFPTVYCRIYCCNCLMLTNCVTKSSALEFRNCGKLSCFPRQWSSKCMKIYQPAQDFGTYPIFTKAFFKRPWDNKQYHNLIID